MAASAKPGRRRRRRRWYTCATAASRDFSRRRVRRRTAAARVRLNSLTGPFSRSGNCATLAKARDAMFLGEARAKTMPRASSSRPSRPKLAPSERGRAFSRRLRKAAITVELSVAPVRDQFQGTKSKGRAGRGTSVGSANRRRCEIDAIDLNRTFITLIYYVAAKKRREKEVTSG